MQRGNETDHLALLAFKAAITNDPFGALNLWNESIHFCQWAGVTCGLFPLIGSVSPHVGNLSFLRELWLGNNSLSHKIPPELGRLRRLQILAVVNNSVTGEIPSNISGCSNLVALELSGNMLTGIIPTELGSLTKLERLLIDRNDITEGLPFTLGNLSSLTNLTAYTNSITGNILDTLGGCKKLEVLRLGVNKLVGTFRFSIFNLTFMRYLEVSNNQIEGSLPSDLGITLPNLQRLDLGDNLFTGYIPISVSNASKLHYLTLKANRFKGKVPPLEKLRDLEVLYLSRNLLGTGEVDDLSFLNSLRNATKLQFLALTMSDNRLSGNIPDDIGNLQKLRVLLLYGNKLYGEIPSCLSNSTSLFQLALFQNSLQGSIPLSLGKCQLLQQLSLAHNNLSGIIPKEVFSSSSLFYLDLSYNNLAGELPAEVGNLKNLEEFHASKNTLSGRIPSSLVYKGILDQSGKVVAVKVLNLQFRGASKSFIAECKAMKSIKLRNLVGILTACSSIDYQGNDFKALVYEFMVNGSLHEWLHPIGNGEGVHEELRSLNLLQRLHIAIDVASALDYLHHHCWEPIVHCDLKPSNVLLDNEMTARVPDFCLARFLPTATHQSSANQSSSIGLRGSVGYAPPEYGMGNEVSTSGDVYSYGILLLEMVTGKRPTDSMFTGSLTLHNFAKTALPEPVDSIFDQTLIPQDQMVEASTSISSFRNQSSLSSHKIQECLMSLLQVGIACSQEQATDRPDIYEILTRLHKTKNILLVT
ncbi:hypothetical protein RHMOL_Rhmol01G0060900 [Rhododendron molle]|uniref:Uncharacterized protein n=1 Tax=Rhododendron molle TaxID=49168 RepID=A0ACC0PZ41_RHOML|nr:hypothetical protein RHMOL_Rhmol01G0060900 [Rhododendron molle]